MARASPTCGSRSARRGPHGGRRSIHASPERAPPVSAPSRRPTSGGPRWRRRRSAREPCAPAVPCCCCCCRWCSWRSRWLLLDRRPKEVRFREAFFGGLVSGGGCRGWRTVCLCGTPPRSAGYTHPAHWTRLRRGPRALRVFRGFSRRGGGGAFRCGILIFVLSVFVVI